MENKLWLILLLLALGGYFFVAAAVVKTFRYRYGGVPVSRALGRVVYVVIGTGLVVMAMGLAWKA